MNLSFLKDTNQKFRFSPHTTKKNNKKLSQTISFWPIQTKVSTWRRKRLRSIFALGQETSRCHQWPGHGLHLKGGEIAKSWGIFFMEFFLSKRSSTFDIPKSQKFWESYISGTSGHFTVAAWTPQGTIECMVKTKMLHEKQHYISNPTIE